MPSYNSFNKATTDASPTQIKPHPTLVLIDSHDDKNKASPNFGNTQKNTASLRSLKPPLSEYLTP